VKRRLITLLLVLGLALFVPGSALAQDYYFSVPEQVVNVYVNEDGTYSLDYVWEVQNQPSGHAIEFWDVGMPNDSYSTSNVSADVNGVPVGISESDYLGSGSGFSVVMGSETIPPGGSGTIHVRVDGIRGVLYPDSEDNTYASTVFAPSYFGSQYITGNTDLTVTFHLPPGIQPDEPRYHIPRNWPGEDAPVASIDDEGRITYSWQSSGADTASAYFFGASFPQSYVPAGAIVTAPPEPAFDLGAWVGNIMPNLFSTLCCGGIIFLVIGLPIIGAVQNRRRKLQYIPPKIGIEGHGIKRGLTAVEAAVLMEEPLDKVFTMILFGVVKKGAATVVSRDPLKVRSTEKAPEGLHEYELNFLTAMEEDTARERQTELQAMVVSLVKSVGEKMRGFSRRETVDYYKNIMERAWEQVERADTPEVKSQKIDENLEWTMLDRDYDRRARDVFTGPVFVPMWWGAYDPSYRPTGGAAAAPAAPVPGRSSSGGALPGASFAAGIVNGVQNFSAGVLGGNVGEFTSKVTSKTNPVPVTSSRSGGSSSGGGGHSCACACACAGCACACAGGGR
jgi:uncharacterized protein YaaR (DUF327 family)